MNDETFYKLVPDLIQEETYEVYKSVKNLIERVDCCNKDHTHEPIFNEWHEAIKIFDSLGRGYAERYEKEKQDAEK